MWFSESTELATEEKFSFSDTGFAATVIAVIGTIVFGVDPNLFFSMFKFVTP